MLSIWLRHKDLVNHDVVSNGFLQTGGNGLLACAGCINGVFGSSEEQHIAVWKSKKIMTKFREEEADGTTVIREREHFAYELSAVFATGETATLE
jgi:hypothetical protein